MKEDLLFQIKNEYDSKIRPLVRVDNLDLEKISSLIKSLSYKLTGNEDILVSKKYDKKNKQVLENFNEVFERMKDSTEVYELFKELEEDESSLFLDLTDKEKKSFAESIQNPRLKLEILNTILLGVFCTLCLYSAGFDIEF